MYYPNDFENIKCIVVFKDEWMYEMTEWQKGPTMECARYATNALGAF